MAFKSIGTDTEVFAVNIEGKHKAICGLIGGTKQEPLQINGLPKGFCVQEDNVSLEYNIPPVIHVESWLEYNQIIFTKMQEILNRHKLYISQESSVTFDDDELTHPNALVFGCEPDYDAWRKVENERPHSDNLNLRTAGGHIHVGTDMDMITGIRQMDLVLGVPSVLLDDTEASRNRRKLYGKAGALRPKNYGFEYRTLSNFWIFKPELIEWVFHSVRDAVRKDFNVSKYGDLIQHTINTGDKDAARGLIKDFGLALPYSV